MIEVIVGLSLFALVTGIVTEGFLIGLKLYKDADVDPNEAVITTMLINRIKNNTTKATMHFIGQEEWDIEVKNPINPISGTAKLYALNISIAKLKDSHGNAVTPIEKKEYNIFRYLP